MHICFWANVFISLNKSHAIYVNLHNNNNKVFAKKTYTLAGFEPGPSVPLADAMATVPFCTLYVARKGSLKLATAPTCWNPLKVVH
jgi:hypothetical protein